MEFPFNVNKVFRKKICKLGPDLVPDGHKGADVAAAENSRRVATVLDAIGMASAKAQDLHVAVTTSERLRSSDHFMYLLTDPDGNDQKGTVQGFLKMGYKNLFLFDKKGHNHEMRPLCVLDFYICESVQRKGLGKHLYDHMLADVSVQPQHMAVDKPSDKFMFFMNKHYSLARTIPQANNYVVYEQFFSSRPDGTPAYPSRVHPSRASPVRAGRGGRRVPFASSSPPQRGSNLPLMLPPPSVGRHAARKPPASMALILNHGPSPFDGARSFSAGTGDQGKAAAAAAAAAATSAPAGKSSAAGGGGGGQPASASAYCGGGDRRGCGEEAEPRSAATEPASAPASAPASGLVPPSRASYLRLRKSQHRHTPLW